jgi:hypothetical protein
MYARTEVISDLTQVLSSAASLSSWVETGPSFGHCWWSVQVEITEVDLLLHSFVISVETWVYFWVTFSCCCEPTLTTLFLLPSYGRLFASVSRFSLYPAALGVIGTRCRLWPLHTLILALVFQLELALMCSLVYYLLSLSLFPKLDVCKGIQGVSFLLVRLLSISQRQVQIIVFGAYLPRWIGLWAAISLGCVWYLWLIEL